jgi:hypothetical protein
MTPMGDVEFEALYQDIRKCVSEYMRDDFGNRWGPKHPYLYMVIAMALLEIAARMRSTERSKG